jgi:hypothetical protein
MRIKCRTCDRELSFKQGGETHLVTIQGYDEWATRQRVKGHGLGFPELNDDNYYEVVVIDEAVEPIVEPCDWEPCVEHRKSRGDDFQWRKVAILALLAFGLGTAPAHAWMNSKGNPATGSAGLDDWVSTHRAGWGYDTWNPTNTTVYTNNTSIRYQGRTYGIEIEGGFNASGTRNDKLAISWGEVGKKAGKGFLAGGAGAAVATADVRMWGLGALGGGLVGAFIGYLEELEAGHTLFHDGSHQSNTNCPCSTGGGGDTGTPH